MGTQFDVIPRAVYGSSLFPTRVPIKHWTKGVEFEDAARQQVINVAALPFVWPWVAVMPDVHFGKGATVGSVIPTDGAIIPAAVGVDIGCGMIAVLTELWGNDLPKDLSEHRTALEAYVPHGRTNNGGARDEGSWDVTPADVDREWLKIRGPRAQTGHHREGLRRGRDYGDDRLHDAARGLGRFCQRPVGDRSDQEACHFHRSDRSTATGVTSVHACADV